MALSLRASGIVDGTRFFINPTATWPAYKSWTDMTEVANGVYTKMEENIEVEVEKMSSKCQNEYKSFSFPDHGFIMLMRHFLNTSKGTVGRTYLTLHNLEIAKVKVVGHDKIKILSVIDKADFQNKLEDLGQGLSKDVLEGIVFM